MMRLFTFFTLVTIAVALPQITRKGNKLYTPDGNTFYVVGVDYQPSIAANNDPLGDIAGLTRDIPYLQALKVNAIRVYSASSTANHDQGMKMLENAGIYVLLDATEPSFSIDANAPHWNLDILLNMQAKIANFAKYTNILGFLAGNEVINFNAQNAAAPYVKAAVRDVKAYLKTIGSTALVGYASTDVSANDALHPYLECDDAADSVDFYGINTYRWCNGDTFQTAAYGAYNQVFSAPLIFTEFGCTRDTPRLFHEVASIFGPDMQNSMSGGFVFQYTQESNGFGLVKLASDGSLSVLDDYNNLKDQLSMINPPKTGGNLTTTMPACPATSSDLFPVVALPLPPVPDNNLCNCMYKSLSCVVKSTAAVADIQGAVSNACAGRGVTCDDIDFDSSTASYGQWSGCSALQRASYAVNAYYSVWGPNQGSVACNFGGVGQLQTPSTCTLTGTTPILTQSPIKTATKSSAAAGTVSSTNLGSATKTVTNTPSSSANNGGSGSSGGLTGGSYTTSGGYTSTGSSSTTTGGNTQNRYQTIWDAAFSAGAVNSPTFLLFVIPLLFLLA